MGEYFGNRELSGNPVTHRRDRGINLDFAKTSQPGHVPATGFSARWQGSLQTKQAGEDRFGLTVRGDRARNSITARGLNLRAVMLYLSNWALLHGAQAKTTYSRPLKPNVHCTPYWSC